MTRLCSKCGVEKPIDEFDTRPGGNGHRYSCKKCLNNYRKDRWRIRNQEKYDKERAFQKDHPGQKQCIKCGKIKDYEKFNVHKTATDGRRNICKRCQAIYAHNQHKEKKEALRAQNLKKFGITHEDYLQMLESQDGKCMICGTTKPHKSAKFKHFAVDHCHKTNKIRALLCNRCNMGLGQFNDDPVLLVKATAYLHSFKS